MRDIENIISSEIDNRNSSFVFPSEVVAAFWRQKSILDGKKAILSDRFISWDKFKEKTFSLNMESVPVNNYIRTLFTASLLEENRKGGNLFKGIIRPEHSEGSGSFLLWVRSILTEVKSFHDSGIGEKIFLSDAVQADLSFLYSAYKKFLNERQMFEPSWIQAEIAGINRKYYLFFPEVIEDFGEFSRDLLEASSVNIVTDVKKDLKEIKLFSSSILELKWLLGEIGSLLDSGVKVQDIAVTLPDMNNWRINLEAEAQLRSIPLDFRQGKSLSEYPGGKLFGTIINCAKSGFTLSSMKQMLLNRSIPWKKRGSGEDLFAFGLEHHCFKNYRFQGREVDLWDSSLGKLGEKNLLDYYRRLKSGIERIISAENFSDLKGRVYIFISDYFDTSLWDSSTLREFQFCLDTLKDLEDASERAGNLDYGSSCDIWLSAIEERIYVKKSISTGISVFPYRVAGGADFQWHFIPGLSQEFSQVVKSRYRFLKDNQRGFLSGLETDFTEAFLYLYSRSRGATFFSCSRDTFAGPGLPPSLFVLKDAIFEMEEKPVLENDIYRQELEFWRGIGGFPERIYPVMFRGADYMLSSALVAKNVDYTRTNLGSTLNRDIVSGLLTENRYLKISSSSLDQFVKCPYLYMLNRGLRINEEEYSENYLDHALWGQIIHECLDSFFNKIVSTGRKFELSITDEYKREMEIIVDSVFNAYHNRGKNFIPPVWEYCRRVTKEKMNCFIDVEGLHFPEFGIISTEKRYTAELDEQRIELNGRIDRISFKGDKTAVIDYKKRNHYKKGDIVATENDPATFQIPFYIFLMRKNGMDISSASYYDVTDCKYDHVMNPDSKKAWCSRETMEGLIIYLEKRVSEMDRRIRAGDFRVPSDGCLGCSFRRICRTRYHVRY